MSVITTVVFVTQDHRDAERFQQIVREGYTRYDEPYETKPLESNGPKFASGYVFYEGFNHLDWDCYEALKAEKWKDPASVLWTVLEEWDPSVTVGHNEVVLEKHPDDWYWGHK